MVPLFELSKITADFINYKSPTSVINNRETTYFKQNYIYFINWKDYDSSLSVLMSFLFNRHSCICFGAKGSSFFILWYNFSVRLLAFHSFLNRSKLEAKRLETQWKKICDHEKRSKERNKELLKDFERVEKHAALLAVKTERLKAYKVALTSSVVSFF